MIKNNIVVIHIDTFRREYSASWILGQKLKKEGFNILLTSRHSTKRLLKIFFPNIFIATHINTIDTHLIKKLKKRGTKVFIHEAEAANVNLQVSLSYLKYDNNHEKIDYNLFSGIFLWNNFTLNWLLKNKNINRKNLHLTGSIRKSKYCEISKRNESKFTVGFLSRYELINTYDNRHIFDNLITIDPEGGDYLWWYERLSIDAEAFSISFKLIKKLVKNGYNVSIRPHPNENIEAYKKLKKYFGPLFSIDTSNSINEWLSKVNVIFGTNSSAFAEAYLLNIPIISSSKIQNFNFQKNNDYLEMSDNFDLAAYLPNSTNEAYDMCIDKKLQPKKSSKIDYFLDEFYSIKNKIDPVDKIVEVLNFHKNKPKLMGFLYYIFHYLFVLVCDLLLVFKYIILLRSYTKFKMINNYNYNRLFHKPTSFMKDLIT
tara:strand:+ start:1190 stop:2473 length:1284 start_codon:yes stop_codon:yes gene_type:complete